MNFEEKFGKQSCTILYKEERKAGGLLCVRKSRHCCCVSVASVSCLHDATDPDEVLVVVNQKLPIKISKFQKKNGNSAFKKLGMTSCLKALIVTWQCYNNSISCFEAAMKCKVWLTLICPMPNHQLVRCKRLDGGPQHTALATAGAHSLLNPLCAQCAHCADCAVCSCCAAAGAETTKEKEEWDTADQRDILLVALTLFSLCDGNLNSTPSFAFICSPEKKREGRRWGRQRRRRMDKSSSLVIDPPDGGCRVSFYLSQERKFYLSINGHPDSCFWLSLFLQYHKAFNWR